ncbi:MULTISPECIES: aspartate aminotransferase family protein [unclassified Mesorhizobium]|uniref:class-III pyridoxal-phosphate-dependent aminotransferase n=1 Tax=unclassified Mesorhizobium TaxID=325217 RepID=UPI000FD87164|nr:MULTISPECIES: aspartate aminotransferase family protein [unclassified Mesorhizobium]TGQ11507.1 aspartate aminotransferase family protein [Mesorhizobium sp. M2E.F.Ca.ET.219.01.1.1]TGT64307.1 aspartate aminotransferase family protein [Mesorhizobium sp. M2E.F.Ca.ET.166.01.1.1]TGV97238.1 aspartate aminotransferase family protein [Mesorhizobium sp. M2E.F.Ca.ET.154.01.1.1]
MYDFGPFEFESKQDFFDKAMRFWNPDKTRFWQKAGIDLVIGRREGYFLYDMSGRRLIDLHLNGGTYNLGHRNPQLVETLKSALDYFDIGNHWFPSVARTALAESLINVSPGMKYAIFAPGGAEAVDIAIKSARYATKRRKIVSIIKGYHGHSGLAVATGDDRFTKIFLSDQPETFIQVPFNDIDAMAQALEGEDVAALIMETIPATYGFPMPKDGYLNACKALCEKHGAMYIADEVQTGLMRTGSMWGWQAYGVQPDIMVTAKGLSGGLYPISAALVNDKAGGWLNEDGAAHISTTGGAELGCVVGHKVIEMLQRPELVANVGTVTEFMTQAMREMLARHGDIFTGVRQKGVILGLEFSNHPEGAVFASRALYEQGVWAIFSSLDKRVLQWKPGVLLDPETCRDIMDRFDAAMPRARELLHQAGKAS